ncbi:LysR family transcriptional regulator [Burkholderia arboris]|uniref:LysR family transcriptional regulator n=1 Tax=Burkholderia arboris TaxID=488730 RepID=UPI001CA45603|nr:LysR family transcriptional regulator [Burkholderia arboris]MBY8608712.1 LysR family transcriptional regulator [Burkholderia arboris]
MELGKVTVRQLETFAVMMTSSGLKEAATKLGCSIPAISKALAVIESQAHSRLFVRVGGRLQATAEAHRLLPVVQRALHHVEAARSEILQLSESRGPVITIAAGGGALPYLVPEAIRRMRTDVPALRAELINEPTEKILSMVANHEIDLGVATPPRQDVGARVLQLCEIRNVMNSALVVVLRREHPLARRSVIRPADLAGLDLITLYKKSPANHLLVAAFAEANAQLNVAIEVTNSMSACYLVSCGAGIGLVHPEVLRSGAFSQLVAAPFQPRVDMRTCLYLPRNKADSPLLSRFIEHVEEVARERT